MGAEELDFEMDLTEDEAADDWLRARRLDKEALEEMEKSILIPFKEKQ